MKKFLAVFLSVLTLVVGVFAFAACGDGNKTEENGNGGGTETGGNTENVTVNVYLPDGTPALALAKVMTEGVSVEGYDVELKIIAAGDIGKVFAATNADLAIMPTIGAATNFTKGVAIQLVSTNVFGNLYIVGVNAPKEEIALADLKGKTVMTTAATTIQLLEYLLKENGIKYEEGDAANKESDTVYLQSYNDGSQIIQALAAADSDAYGVLGEPQVTVCQSKVEGAEILVDFQEEWTKLTTFDGYPQASLIVKKSFADANGAFVNAFADTLKDNATWLSSSDNIAKFKAALVSYNESHSDYQTSLANAALTVDTVVRCNLGYQSAADVKASVKDYIQRLSNTELADGFFYAAA